MVPCTELSGRAEAGYCDRGHRESGCFRWMVRVRLSEEDVAPWLKHKREIDEEGAGRRMNPSERPVGLKYRVRDWAGGVGRWGA